jgi:hypothetical protein
VDLSQLISEYDRALKDQKYTLETRAMLMQEQNLRLPELHRFMNACGIEGVTNWIERHSEIKVFFESDDCLTASAESELAELIKYRNDAAHGSIEIGDILHVNVLVELCDFVSAICEALSERVQLAGLHTLKPHAHVIERGRITESLNSGMVAIGAMTGAFKVGHTVYLCGETYCLERSIISLQLDGVPYEEVDLTATTELGMMFDAPAKKNAVIMMVEPLHLGREADDQSGDADERAT